MSRRLRISRVGLVFLSVLSVLWAMVLLVGGEVGPYAWWGLMVFGLLATVSAIVTVIKIAFLALHRQKPDLGLLLLLVVCLFAAWPGAWLFGLGQIAYPASIRSVEPGIYVRLPVDEPALVGWGGNTLADNYHAWLPVERWAYDLMSPPALLASDCLEDYGIYGMNVVAPAAGLIVEAHDGEADNPPGMDYSRLSLGNHIYLQLEETGTYLVIAHLKTGSVMVKAGERVNEGDVLAEAGNSGASSEPHLHIHHQRQDPRTRLLLAEGLPLFFRGIDGPAMPRGGGDRLEAGVRVPNGEVVCPLK